MNRLQKSFFIFVFSLLFVVTADSRNETAKTLALAAFMVGITAVVCSSPKKKTEAEHLS